MKRREYDVYLETEVSLGIACGPEMVPKGAEVFKVREVLPGDEVPPEQWTDAVIELQQLRSRVAELERERDRLQFAINDAVESGDISHLRSTNSQRGG